MKTDQTHPRAHSTFRLARALLSLASVSLAGGAFAQTTLVNDTFADGARDSGESFAEPASLIWRYSTSAGSLSASSNALVASDLTATRNIVTYFTQNSAGGGAPVSLGVGDRLRISFNLSFSGSLAATTDGVRFGVFNSFATAGQPNAATTSTRLTGINSVGTTNATYANYAGYLTSLSLLPPNTNYLKAWERGADSANNNLLSLGSGIVQLGTSGGSDLDFVAGNTYTVTLTFERGAVDSLHYTTAIYGNFASGEGTQSLLRTDSESAIYAFDTFAVYGGANVASSLTLDNFSVEVTSAAAIPEPSTYALLVGGLMMAWTVHRRRQHRRAG